MSELAGRLVIKQPTLSKAIDRMEAAQLVRRRTPVDDHRRALVHLTERGLQLATKSVMDIQRHEASIADMLGKAPLRRLRRKVSVTADVPGGHGPDRRTPRGRGASRS
jgi:DNA-binding MarR family transcriptional regulator